MEVSERPPYLERSAFEFEPAGDGGGVLFLNYSETLLEGLRFNATVFVKFRISELAGEVGLLFFEGSDASRQFGEFTLFLVV